MEELLKKYSKDIKIEYLNEDVSFCGAYDFKKEIIYINLYKNNIGEKYTLLHEIGHSKDKLIRNDFYMLMYNIGKNIIQIFSLILLFCYTVLILLLFLDKDLAKSFKDVCSIFMLFSFIISLFYIRAEIIADYFAIKTCFKENIKIKVNNIGSLLFIFYLFGIILYLF